MCDPSLTPNDKDDIAHKVGFEGGSCMCRKLARDHPNYPWALMYGAYEKVHETYAEANYRNPQNFGILTDDDHAGYGIIEVLENLVSLAFEYMYRRYCR